MRRLFACSILALLTTTAAHPAFDAGTANGIATRPIVLVGDDDDDDRGRGYGQRRYRGGEVYRDRRFGDRDRDDRGRERRRSRDDDDDDDDD
ncbi:hypothetical protein [Methylobacterium sp. Leaf466]|uniref:hypothetical protein n=2 Tax=unclassified Methylobacterium TaxID=2615210 RepID=UPI0007014864|nr:hypothetical protein [Methylobacterium sp. Leaf466]KQT83004.1 hypothetical protein ASG59_18345 [Methylobacterium sp. Leaf466]